MMTDHGRRLCVLVLTVFVVTVGVSAQQMQELQGVVLYDSAGSPPFYLEVADTGEVVPLSGSGADLFGSIGETVVLTGSWDGGSFTVDAVTPATVTDPMMTEPMGTASESDAAAFLGEWIVQVLVDGTWYDLAYANYSDDGTYVSQSLETGEVTQGEWMAFEGYFTTVEPSGYSECEWSYFEEGVLRLAPAYYEDAQGNSVDVSELPDFFLVPQF